MKYTIKDHNEAVARRWNNPDTLTKKPDNWQELKRHELTRIIHELNCWNCSQPVSDHHHTAHYKSEIEPLVKLRASLNNDWINKQ